MTLLFILLGVYGLYAGFIFAKQRDLLFPATRLSGALTTSPLPRDAERIVIPVPGGQTQAWLLAPSAPHVGSAGVLIFAHGNGELIDEWAPLFSEVRRRGLGVLLVEYPGYGYSSGHPSESSIAVAMTGAYDELLTREWVDASRISAYGRSLGGGAVLGLARTRPLAAIVLQSTFTSVRSFAHGLLVPEFLVRDPFDNLAAIRAYPGPVLIMHGKADTMIPFAHGQRLAAAASPNARLVPMNCAHNDCPPDWAGFWNEMIGFLDAAKGPRAADIVGDSFSTGATTGTMRSP
jgi:uncharacterized protein